MSRRMRYFRQSWHDCQVTTIALPFIGHVNAAALSTMNDNGATFAEIADFIEGSVDF